MKFLAPILCLCMILQAFSAAQAAEPNQMVVGKIQQEVPVRLNSADDISLEDSQLLFVDSDGTLHLRTADHHLLMERQDSWKVAPVEEFPNGNQVIALENRLIVATDSGLVQWKDGQSQSIGLSDKKVNGISVSSDGRWAAATNAGLLESIDGETWQEVHPVDAGGRMWAARDVRCVIYDNQDRLWMGQPAGLACRTAEGWQFFEGRDGLPYSDFTCAAAGSDGRLWFGTGLGLVGLDPELLLMDDPPLGSSPWIYRQGPRFLAGDSIRSIAVTPDGTPWMASQEGVSGLTKQPMTLAEKALFYEDQIDRYIKRTPFGYTSEVQLTQPGDFSKIIYTDSDNDGLWTAMYGASQCFAVAVTGSQSHHKAAKQAFEAIRFLQKVTQGGTPAPPHGYIARTILPIDGPDPNEGRLENDRRMQATRDRLWKVYEPRWPVSADRQWYWKSDTSSDELDGHYFFLPLYYDLVADSEEEKDRVREVVRDLTDHLLEHNFQMVDVDGTPTRWAIFNPENLNQNPNWWTGRGLNSLSMMAYLTVAEHVTGDAKYGQALEKLRKEHSYEANAMVAKVQYGPGSGNQSDDEMAIMSFYSLIKYAKDPQLKQTMLYSMYTYWRLMQPERNPFFHFAYAAHGLSGKHETTHARFRLDPWNGWLEDSIQTLIGFPLDRLNWAHQNSHRLDVVFLQRQSRSEPGEGMRRTNRGHLVDGKVLPVENRHFNHWNTDPWALDYSGDGRQLASGTVFLLPYYMGRYHGFIAED